MRRPISSLAYKRLYLLLLFLICSLEWATVSNKLGVELHKRLRRMISDINSGGSIRWTYARQGAAWGFRHALMSIRSLMRKWSISLFALFSARIRTRKAYATYCHSLIFNDNGDDDSAGKCDNWNRVDRLCAIHLFEIKRKRLRLMPLVISSITE